MRAIQECIEGNENIRSAKREIRADFFLDRRPDVCVHREATRVVICTLGRAIIVRRSAYICHSRKISTDWAARCTAYRFTRLCAREY